MGVQFRMSWGSFPLILNLLKDEYAAMESGSLFPGRLLRIPPPILQQVQDERGDTQQQNEPGTRGHPPPP